jgi:hypothetical protein
MVQPKWTILVLSYDQGGTHLFVINNGSRCAGRWTEDGWMDDYEVLEKIPPFRRAADTHAQGPGWPDVSAIADAMLLDPRDADWRDDSLRIVPESVKVHRVKRVDVTTDEFTVKRHRRETARSMQTARTADTKTGARS